MTGTRVVTLCDEINPRTAKDVMTGLMELDPEGYPIILLINSPGGEVYSAFGIIDVITAMTCPVITVCTGAAFSGAALVLMAGKMRFATKHSRIMLHEPSQAGIQGSYQDLQVDTIEMGKCVNSMVDIIAHYTHKDKDRIKQDLKKDFYLSPQEAKDYGIIDHIGFLNSTSLINSISIEVPEEIKRPKTPKAKTKGKIK